MEKFLIKEIIAPIAIILIAIILYNILSKIVKKLFKVKKVKDDKKSKTLVGLINSVIKYFIIIIAILMILEVFNIDTKSIVASLGVVALVIGLALQDLLKDFLGGAAIILEQQYNVGDTVTINGFKGEVIALGLKTTRLRAYTGEVKIFSNRVVTEVINHSISNLLSIVDVTLSYNNKAEKVEKVLTKLNEKLNKDLKTEITLLPLNDFNNIGMVYRFTASVKPEVKFDLEREIRKQLKETLEKENIVISQVVTTNERV